MRWERGRLRPHGNSWPTTQSCHQPSGQQTNAGMVPPRPTRQKDRQLLVLQTLDVRGKAPLGDAKPESHVLIEQRVPT